jgi:short-subunit dehydrogenase
VNAHPGRVAALELDVTKAGDVENAARAATDVEVLVNNAGAVAHFGGEAGDAAWLRAGREEMEVNVFGPMALTQAFAPVLARNGGGAVVNVVSVAGLVNFPVLLSYSLSKAALHSLSQAFRKLLRPQGTQVFAVYPGPVDTEMAARLPLAKTSPKEVAEGILAGLRAGQEEIFPDPFARQMGATFLADPKRLERELAA